MPAMKRGILLFLLLGACGKASPATREYTLLPLGERDPAKAVKLKVTVPSDWTEEVDQTDGSPSFKFPGGAHVFSQMFITALGCKGDDKACADHAQDLNFDKDRPLKIEDGAAGSRWVTDDQSVKGEPSIHLRRILPSAAKHAVVMCGAMTLQEDTKRAGEVRTICDSVVLE
jgi:hypothetical protein